MKMRMMMRMMTSRVFRRRYEIIEKSRIFGTFLFFFNR
jgi:hypothetical protein